MKKITIALSFLFLAATMAYAAGAHWVASQVDATIIADGSLEVGFKIAGLGAAVTTDVTAGADAEATWACRNHGGQWPADPKKTTVAGPVAATGTFTSGKNGAIQATLILPAPGVEDPAGFCPGGQVLTLVAISYTNVDLDNDLAGVYLLPGAYEVVFYVL